MGSQPVEGPEVCLVLMESLAGQRARGTHRKGNSGSPWVLLGKLGLES